MNPAPLHSWDTSRDAGSELVLISRELLGRVPEEELAGTTVFTLDESVDLIGQMTEAIASGVGWQTVRVITHGSAGALWVGNQTVDTGVLETHRTQLKLWGSHLAPQADLLLYGCSIASTTQGKTFVDNIAYAINANVAASINTSGNSGDLLLEYKRGLVKSEIVSSPKLWEKNELDLGVTFKDLPTASVG